MSIKLLRSSFESIRSRFQKLAEDGSVGKAWIVHQYQDVDEPGRPDVFSHADDFNAKKGEIEICLDIGPKNVFAELPEGSYRARRTSQIIGWQAVKGASIDASIVLKTLPDLLKQRLWGALNECRHADTDTGFHWVAITFELAFAEIKGSALRSVRHIPLGGGMTGSIADTEGIFPTQFIFPVEMLGGLEKWEEHRDLVTAADERLFRPKMPNDWYATFDNFAAASGLAVDILLNWLDELEADPQSAAVVTVKTKQPEVAAEQLEPRRKPGRPLGSKKSDEAEDRRLWEAWGTRQYKSFAELGREIFGREKNDADAENVKQAVDRHRKRLKADGKKQAAKGCQ